MRVGNSTVSLGNPTITKRCAQGWGTSRGPAQELQRGGSLTDPAGFGEQKASEISSCGRETHLSLLKYPGLENHELFKIIS